MNYHPEKWKHPSPDTFGWHEIVTSENSECRELQIFRLNLKAGSTFLLTSELELAGTVISGKVDADMEPLGQFDGLYLPGGDKAVLAAREDSVVYIGGAKSDHPGKRSFSHFNPQLPIGEIHQIHGVPPYDREVFFTLSPNTPASRLIAGVTWSRSGAWTSWPPHQHEKDLEEAYFYFGPEKPGFGLHLSYLESGTPVISHLISAGDCVEVPAGYHPTVAIPGKLNAYFWVLAAKCHESRQYDLARMDPFYV